MTIPTTRPTKTSATVSVKAPRGGRRARASRPRGSEAEGTSSPRPKGGACPPERLLDTFDNPHPGRPYRIAMDCPEFTCLCPKTGQPDFADLAIEYVPAARCVELKSLKLYLWSYRDQGGFHEDLTNRILDDLVAALAPRALRITARFKVRGGIATTIRAEHGDCAQLLA